MPLAKENKMVFVSFDDIEAWCKKQKESGFSKINLDHLRDFIEDDLFYGDSMNTCSSSSTDLPKPTKNFVCAGFSQNGCKCNGRVVKGTTFCRHHIPK